MDSVFTEAMEPSPYRSMFASISYGLASMAMVFINKAILMQYAYSMTLLTLQQLATALLIHFGRVMGYTKARAINLTTAKTLLPVSLFYNANVAFALASLKGVNIPMYIALKRLTPLAVLVAGFFSGKGRPPTQGVDSLTSYEDRYKAFPNRYVTYIWKFSLLIYTMFSVLKMVSLSVLFIAFGVIIAALGDFSFDLFGYSMTLTSVFFQTMYLMLVEKSGVEDGLSSLEIMFYNSFLSLPFLLFLIIATGEFPHSLSIISEKADSLSFLVTLILSLLMRIVLNYTMFLCTLVNSALTTTIVGVLKGVGSTTFGFVLLGGVQVHALNVTGLIINTAGGIWYSYAKYQQKRKAPRKIIADEEAYHK